MKSEKQTVQYLWLFISKELENVKNTLTAGGKQYGEITRLKSKRFCHVKI